MKLEKLQTWLGIETTTLDLRVQSGSQGFLAAVLLEFAYLQFA